MSDETRQSALLYDLTIIGEASNRITKETRAQHPDIPWADIVSQRNRIVHDYFGLDWILLWTTITEGVPVLRRRVAEILADFDRMPDQDALPRSVQVLFGEGDSEHLLLTALRGELYRAEESSMLGEVRWRDVIEARTVSDGSLQLYPASINIHLARDGEEALAKLQFVRVVTPSGLKTNSWILSKDIIESEALRTILDSVMELGGNWEQCFGGVLLVHLPPESSDAVDSRINELLQPVRSKEDSI